MASLSSDLISEFVKITNDTADKPKSESTVYGTAVSYDDGMYVRIDGSNQLTPIATTATIKEGDRVMVLIKNHSATVTGNVSSPSASSDDLDETNGKVEELGGKIDEFDIIIADKVSTTELEAQKARIDYLESENITVKGQLTAASADIDDLQAENVTITEKLTAAEADIDSLQADNVTINGKLTAAEADIDDLEADNATINGKLTATEASIGSLEGNFATFQTTTTENLKAVNASIDNLEATKLSAEQADLKYANIDFTNIGKAAIENFFSKSGMIGDLVVGEGTVTGTLVGVTIKGDLIEGGTVKADKLVVQGEDGLYYKLNISGETVAAEQTEYNSLNGSIITANTITAEKINVNDLVAFDATIGGFKITESSLYSGVKESADNTTRGIFLGDDGQVSFGDQSNYLKYYHDVSDDTWKLAISANAIKFGTSGKDIEEAVGDLIQENIGDLDLDLSVGGTNLIPNSSFEFETNGWSEYPREANEEAVQTIEVISDAYMNSHGLKITSSNYTIGDDLQYGVSLDNTDLYIPKIDSDGSATLSAWIRVDSQLQGTKEDTVFLRSASQEDLPKIVIPKNAPIGEWVFYQNTGKYSSDMIPTGFFVLLGNNGSYTISRIKLELGDVATDWSPSPRDVATNEDVTNVSDSVDTIGEDLLNAQASIELLQNSISSLVVDENGESLMTQTDEGFRFDISSITNTLNDATTSISEIEGDVGQLDSLVENINSTTKEISEKTAYITITQDDSGNPQLELGKADDPFKVRITNTAMEFVENNDVIAYITNKKLFIETGVFVNELQIGDTVGFIWKRRSNGNMGLRWNGGD